MKTRNTLLATALLAVFSVQANAFEFKLPSFLGGKPNISVTPQNQQNSEPATPYVAPAPIKAAQATVNVAAIEIPPQSSSPYAVTTEIVTVNPFTGNRSDIESRRVQVERATLEADLLGKQYEAEKQRFLLDNKDKIFSYDMKERLGQGRSQVGMPTSYPDVAALPKPDSKKLAKEKKARELLAAQYAPIARPYVEPTPKLMGVVTVGGVKKAMIEVNGNTATFSEGDTLLGKTVTDIQANSVKLNGAKINLAQVTNTLVNPDKQTLGSATTGASVQYGAPVGVPMPMSMPMVQGVGDPSGAEAHAYNQQFSEIIDTSTPEGRDRQAMSNLENMQ